MIIIRINFRGYSKYVKRGDLSKPQVYRRGHLYITILPYYQETLLLIT